jgi:hypothetical protein
MTLHNPHRDEIRQIRLAGPIPPGTTFRRILESPREGQTRIEGEEVVWNLPRVAPRSSLGPFSYEVRATGEATLIQGHAKVAWVQPVAGTAASSHLTLVARAEAATWQKVLDLSHTLSSTTPIWPGFNPIQIQTLVTHDKDGFYANHGKPGSGIRPHTGT